MTPEQRDLLGRLSACRMSPGSWDKRFIRDVSAKPPGYPLSPKQLAVLGRLEHRYRRQLGPGTGAPPAAGTE